MKNTSWHFVAFKFNAYIVVKRSTAVSGESHVLDNSMGGSRRKGLINNPK